MEAYVYYTHLAYSSAEQVLETLRGTVKELKASRPELASCELADVGMTNGKHGIDIALYFKESTNKQKRNNSI
ncbi:MAG: hypothetical protein GX208_06020 [Firmicutes bacterium]|nr:hypothetical protein [Bacillota bacterium]